MDKIIVEDINTQGQFYDTLEKNYHIIKDKIDKIKDIQDPRDLESNVRSILDSHFVFRGSINKNGYQKSIRFMVKSLGGFLIIYPKWLNYKKIQDP